MVTWDQALLLLLLLLVVVVVVVVVLLLLLLLLLFFVASLLLWLERKKKLCTYQCNASGGGGGRAWGGDLTFSKICNQIPCPRANQSSQNNNLGHKGGPSKNSFVKRGGHHILQKQLTGATRRIPPVPSPPLKINGPLPPPPPISHSLSTSPVLEC